MGTLATALEAVRVRIEAETTLTRSTKVDSVRNTPDHKHDKTFAAWPVRSRNIGGTRASDSMVVSDDEVSVELIGRINALEVESFDTALAVAESVRVALTSAAWFRLKTGGPDLQCLTWDSDRHAREGGWVIITQTYTMRRQGVLG